MKKTLKTLLVASLLTCGAVSWAGVFSGDPVETFKRARIALSALFSLNPESGAYSTVQSPCDYAMAQGWVSGYQPWCSYPDGGFVTGTSADGGTFLNMTAQGSPAVSAFPQCPSGSDCTALTGWRQGGTADYYESAAATMKVADGTLCYLAQTDTQTDYDYWAGMADGVGTSFFGVAQFSGVPQARWSTTCAGAAGTANGPVSFTLSALRLVCATVSGTTITAWVDGVAGTPTTSTTYCASVANGKWASGSIGNFAASSFKGRSYGGFWTSKVLNSAEMTALANATLGTLNASPGGIVTTTRATAATCQASDGGMSVLPSGRPCVAQGALLSEPAGTNILLRSAELDNAVSWGSAATGVAAPTVTADAVVAPDGTTTAERIQLPAVGANQGSVRYQSVTTTAAAHTFSCYLKGHSGSGTVYLSTYLGDKSGCATTLCSFTSSGWSRCSVTKTMTAASQVFFVGTERTAGSSCVQADPGATDVDVTDCQLETGSVATSYIPTAGSTYTRNATVHTASNPLPSSATSWCIGGTYKPSFAAWPGSPSYVGIIALGNSPGANTAAIFFDAITGKPIFQVWDNAAATKSATANAGISAATHDVMGCNNSGTLTLYVDGAAIAATVAGAGTGTMASQPASVYAGSTGAGTQALGWVSNLRILPRGAP